MTTSNRPTNPADRALANQVGLLADAAFAQTAPVALPPLVAVAAAVHDDRNDRLPPARPSAPARRNVLSLAAASATLVLLCGFLAFWLGDRGAIEIQVAGQPDSIPTGVVQPDGSEPPVVALPPGAGMPSEVPVAFGELSMGSDENVVLSAGEAYFVPSSINQMIVSRNRGVNWFTFHGPISTARPACINADGERIVATSLRVDDQQWLTMRRHAQANGPGPGGSDAIVPEAVVMGERSDIDRPLYCRPAKIGDRWAIAATDGSLLTVVSYSAADGSQSVSVLSLPDALRGGPARADLYADGDRFVAEICMDVAGFCETTLVAFPAAALESQENLFVYTLTGDEDRTSIAERYGTTLSELLQANGPSLSNDVKIPGIGRIDPAIAEITGPFSQAHPSLAEGVGATWRVQALDIVEDPSTAYSGAGLYAVGRFGDDLVELPDSDVWRVDVFPHGDSARVRVWKTRPDELPAEHLWYERGGGRTWVSIDDPVVDWPTRDDWNEPVTFVEFAPSGRIRVIADAEK